MYYRQALLATMEVGESMPDRKRRLSNPPAASNPITQVMQAVQQKVFFSKNLPIDDLRLTLEESLRHRRPKAFFIEEGHHLASFQTGRWTLLLQPDGESEIVGIHYGHATRIGGHLCLTQSGQPERPIGSPQHPYPLLALSRATALITPMMCWPSNAHCSACNDICR